MIRLALACMILTWAAASSASELRDLTVEVCREMAKLPTEELVAKLRKRESPSGAFHERVLRPLIFYSLREAVLEIRFQEPSRAFDIVTITNDFQSGLGECRTLDLEARPRFRASGYFNKDVRLEDLVLGLMRTADRRGKIMAGASFLGSSVSTGKTVAWVSKYLPRTAMAASLGFAAWVGYDTYWRIREKYDLRKEFERDCGIPSTEDQSECLMKSLDRLSEDLGDQNQKFAALVKALEEDSRKLAAENNAREQARFQRAIELTRQKLN
ncbi:MAG TPA: hypothetical protein PKC28_09460 [Bdellovibrionales bacterium]|nr:hypothetical protein [Bdellovibrionales bacterium]